MQPAEDRPRPDRPDLRRHHTLKPIFKGAAITVIGQQRDKPRCDH
jgi:hypothetical protein